MSRNFGVRPIVRPKTKSVGKPIASLRQGQRSPKPLRSPSSWRGHQARTAAPAGTPISPKGNVDGVT
jgi:hypothetical protein